MNNEEIVEFSIDAPFWGVGQKFNDCVLDSNMGRQEGIDDVRDGGKFYIRMRDLKKIDEKLYIIIKLSNQKNIYENTKKYIKDRGFDCFYVPRDIRYNKKGLIC